MSNFVKIVSKNEYGSNNITYVRCDFPLRYVSSKETSASDIIINILKSRNVISEKFAKTIILCESLNEKHLFKTCKYPEIAKATLIDTRDFTKQSEVLVDLKSGTICNDISKLFENKQGILDYDILKLQLSENTTEDLSEKEANRYYNTFYLDHSDYSNKLFIDNVLNLYHPDWRIVTLCFKNSENRMCLTNCPDNLTDYIYSAKNILDKNKDCGSLFCALQFVMREHGYFIQHLSLNCSGYDVS